MKRILLLNHKEKRCGIYQYGFRIGNILNKATSFIFKYEEINSVVEYDNVVNNFNPDIIIYNYYDITMPFLNDYEIKKYNSIKHTYIHHAGNYSRYFEYIIQSDPTIVETKNSISLPRPLFENYELEYKNNNIPTIGSFGFGFYDKGFDKICTLVNNEFDAAVLNLHITFSYYADNFGDMAKKIADICKSKITKPNIILNITHDFLTDEQMLNFLSNNDVNIYLYDDAPKGISSVIDYSLSVQRPLIINKTYMFKHLHSVNDNLCIEKNNIKNIINNGCNDTDIFRDMWSNENLIKKIEKLITIIYN